MKSLIFSIFAIFITFSSLANEKPKEKIDLRFYRDVQTIISSIYLDNINEEEFIYNSLNGGIGGLDPHSEYIKPEDYLTFKESLEGEFGGVGVQIVEDSKFVKVIAPIEGTPAFKAGMKSGDYIIKIDDENTFKMQLDKASSKIKGKVGTTVKLAVLREGEKDPIEFNLKREKIKNTSVKSQMLDDIMILRIFNFTATTAEEVKKVILEQKNIKGIVLDLRNNPGGALNQAVAVANFFLKKGDGIVKIKSKTSLKKSEEVTNLYCDTKNNCEKINFMQEDFYSSFVATEQTLIPIDTPLVVVINNSSASASEILAGAFKDNKRGVVLGEVSFGKGLIQSIIPLDGGKKGALKISTSQYYTPNGAQVQNLGITPDIILLNGKFVPEDNKLKDLFAVREKDLKNNMLQESLEKAAKTSKEYKDSEEKIKPYYNDAQMLNSLNILRSLIIMRYKAKMGH
jgi:carboxyl-terminal processing protease